MYLIVAASIVAYYLAMMKPMGMGDGGGFV